MAKGGVTRLGSVALACAVIIAAACSSSTDSSSTDNQSNTVTIGPSGGEVKAQGVVLEVPAGALSTATAISIAVDKSATPTGYDTQSPLFHFSPDGLNFAQPATVSITASSRVTNAAIYWSDTNSSAYSALATTWSGAVASAQVSHFSRGCVGVPSRVFGDAGDGTSGASAHGNGGDTSVGGTGAGGAITDLGSAGAAGVPGAVDISTSQLHFSGPITGVLDSATTNLYVALFTATKYCDEPGQPTWQLASMSSASTSTVPTTYSFDYGPNTDPNVCGVAFRVDVAQMEGGATEVPGTLALENYCGRVGSAAAGPAPVLESTNVDCGSFTLAPSTSSSGGTGGSGGTAGGANGGGNGGGTAATGGAAGGAAGASGAVDISTSQLHFSGPITGVLDSATTNLYVALFTATKYCDEPAQPTWQLASMSSASTSTVPTTYSFDYGPNTDPNVCGVAFRVDVAQMEGGATEVPGTLALENYCGRVGSAAAGPAPVLESTNVDCGSFTLAPSTSSGGETGGTGGANAGGSGGTGGSTSGSSGNGGTGSPGSGGGGSIDLTKDTLNFSGVITGTLSPDTAYI